MGKYSFGSDGPTWNGMPMIGGLPMGLTKVWFVDYGNGSDGVSTKNNSAATPFKTIDKAMSAVTTNKNEGIALMGNSTHTLTEMLDVSKSRVHMFGYDPGGRSYGQNAKVSLGVTTAATDIATVQNTGVRNSFRNIKFQNSNTLATNLYTFAEGGEYTIFDGCEFYKSALLTTDLTAELLMNGDSSQFFNCTFGSLVNTRGASGKECPNVMLTREQITGKVCRDGHFENCRFLTKAADADVCHVYGLGATAVERSLVFKDCIFWNCVLAAGTVADAVNFDTAQTQGDVLLINPAGVNITAIAGASLNIYVSSGTAQTTDGVSEEIAA